MNRLEPYNEAVLLELPTKDLRGKVRAEHSAGNLDNELLLSHGIRSGYIGTDIASLRGEVCIAILLGKMNGSAPVMPQPVVQTETIAPAPSVVASDAPNASLANQMAALLTQAIGGVNPETIKIEIARQMEAPIAAFNGKLATSQEKVEAAIAVFTKWQADAQKSVETLKAEIESTRRPQTFEVLQPSGERINVGTQHKTFPELLALLEVGCNVWLVGPAGSGKTFAAEAAAKALGLQFEFNGAIDSEHKLLGFTDAQGRIVSRPFRKCWEHGGLYLFDEVDASLPAALLAFNAALANGFCDFPDGKVDRHPNFRCVAGGNVWNGATADYCGRMKQDAAFLDRFVHLQWNYDEPLELELAKGAALSIKAGTETIALDWTKYVQAVRLRAQQNGVRVVISPRASINGAKILAAGKLTKAQAIAVTMRKGLDNDAWNKIGGAL